jgi:hypothetical protein
LSTRYQSANERSKEGAATMIVQSRQYKKPTVSGPIYWLVEAGAAMKVICRFRFFSAMWGS